MLRNFSFDWRAISRDPRTAVRAALGVLLVANLIAAYFVFQTPGGSLEQLESDIVAARQQVIVRQKAIEQLKKNVGLATSARETGDQFQTDFFLVRRTAYSALETELAQAEKLSGIRPKERTYNYEPIEGSDTLGMVTMNANYEGNYGDLIQFVNAIDRSRSLVIIESMSASPQQQQQQSGTLAINVKMNAFLREEAQP
jgi:hypothetical protein